MSHNMRVTPKQEAVLAFLDGEYPMPVPTLQVCAHFDGSVWGIERNAGWRGYSNIYPVLRQLTVKGLVEQIRVDGYRQAYWRLAPSPWLESVLAKIKGRRSV